MPRTRLGKWLAQGAAQTTASPQQSTLSRPKSIAPSLRKHKSKKAAPRGRAVALARAAQQVQQAPQVQPAQPALQASGAVTTDTLSPTATQSPVEQAVTTNLNTYTSPLDRQQTLGLSAGIVELLLPLRSLWTVALLLRLQGQDKSHQLWELFAPVVTQAHSTDHNGPLFLEAAAAYVQMLSHSVLSSPADTVKAATSSTSLNAGSAGIDSASASTSAIASSASVQAARLGNDNRVDEGATHTIAYSDVDCAVLLSSPARNLQWEKQLMHYVQLAVGHDQQSFRACALLAILATLTAQPHAAYYRHKALDLYQRQDLSTEGLLNYLQQPRLKNGGRSEILLNRWFLQELNALAVQQWGVELVSLPLVPMVPSYANASTNASASLSTNARPLSKGYNASNSARPNHHSRSSAALSPVEMALQLSALYQQQWQALGKGLRQELGSSNIPVTSQQLCAAISSSYELLFSVVRALEDYAGQKVLANAVSSASNEHSTVAVKAVLEKTDASAKQVTPIDNSGHTYSIDSAYDLSLSITAAQHESLPESSKHPEITALPVKPHLAMLGEQVCLDEQGTASSALNATGATSKAHVADPQNANRLQPIPAPSTNGLLSGSSDQGFFTESSLHAQSSGSGAGKAGKAGKAGEAGNKAAVATKETVVAMPDAESSIGTDTGASSIPVLTAPTGSIAKTNGSDSNQGAAHEDSQQSRVVTVQDFGLNALEHLEAKNVVTLSSFRQRLYLWAQKLAALGGMTALSTNERYAALRFLLTPHRNTQQRSTVITSATPAPAPTEEERWRWDLQVVRFTASPLSVSAMPKSVAELKTGQLVVQDSAVTAKPSLMKTAKQSSWSLPFGSVGTAAPVDDSSDITQGRHNQRNTDQSNTWVQVRCALSLLPQDPLALLEVYQQLISLNPYWQQWGLDLFFTWRCEPESDFGSDHHVTEKAETPTNTSSADRTEVNGLKGLSVAGQSSQHQAPELLGAQSYSTAENCAEATLVAAQGAQNPLGDQVDTALLRSTRTGDSSWIQDHSQLCGELVLLLLPRRSFSYSYPDPPPAPMKLLQLWEGVGSAAYGKSATLGASSSNSAEGKYASSQALENSLELGSNGALSYSSAAHPRDEQHEVSSSNSSAVLKQEQAQGQGQVCPHVGTDPIQGSALLDQGGLKLWQWYQQHISGKSKRRLSSYENLVRWGPQFDAVVYAPHIAELWKERITREARGRSGETAIPDSYAQNLVRTQLCLTLGLSFVRYALASVQVCLDESDFRTQARGLYGIQYYATPEPNQSQSMSRASVVDPRAGEAQGARGAEIDDSVALAALRKLCPQLPWQPCSQLQHLSLQQPLCLSLGQLQALMVGSSLQQDYALKRLRERTYIYSYRERLSKRPLSAYDSNFPLRTDVFLGCTNCRALVEEYYQARIRRLHHARPLTLEMKALEALGATAGFVYCQVLPLPSLPPLPRAGAGVGEAQSATDTTELNSIESKDLAPLSVNIKLSAEHLNTAHPDGQNLSTAVPDFSLDVLQRLQQLQQALRSELALIVFEQAQAQAQAQSTSKTSTADTDADAVLPVAQLIGYALGTSYLYLDFVVYDRMCLEQALKRLNDSGKLQALGLGRLHYHSFYREGAL